MRAIAPRVSVVVPCRNESASLPACLGALAAQDLADFEVLVVDGHSTDGCPELARRHRVQLLEDPGRGPSAARNIGIAAARAPIVAFTDADCVPRFDWLSRLVAAFEAHPDAAGVAGAMRLQRDTMLGRLEDNDARLHYAGYITSNVAYRRDVLLTVGGFDEDLQCAEDYDLAWRIMDAGHRIARSDDAIVLHDPPELRRGVAPYLRKQYWYARCDVPAHARALARGRRDRAPASAQAVVGAGHALAASALAAAAASSIAARRWGLAAGAIAGTYAAAVRQQRRDLAALGQRAAEAPKLGAIVAAKRLVRGAGTLAGLVDLARPSGWSYLKPRVDVGVAARPTAPLRLPRSAA